jgi:hypothetical protein
MAPSPEPHHHPGLAAARQFSPDARSHIAHGISVLDKRQLASKLARLGVDLGKNWDHDVYRRRRDSDTAD